ncbi:transmembrane and coiled-coil domain-containing protein 3 isoform X1 [Clinocottus analis]|uniref:transmembrane and coiled-coil domain-containing protein 3 isoform X1 n=1 Tax=Clinocottus analis TaxID=304258 RepID=UPI0035BF853C
MQVVCWLLCLGAVGALAVLQKDQVAQHAIKLYRSKGATHGHSWVTSNCKRLVGLLRQKNVVVRKLATAADAVRGDQALSEPERLFQVHTLEIFQKEMNESEHLVFQAVHGLQRALQGDYRDVVNMKESSRQRLEALREAAIKEEQEYLELVAAEKHQQEAVKSVLAQNKTLSMLDEILEDVRKAADRLEEEIEEHAFDNNKQMRGVNVEAVLRVEEDEESGGKRKNKSKQKEVEDDLGLSMLIDSQNNQYVLTKPRDSTMPRADHHFIKDLVSVVMLSLPCGWICSLVGLPPMFGYIICGVLLGPSGLNSIKSMVQVETLGELGVFFTLFVVGLEFSPERLRKVWKTSVQGSCYLSLLMVGAGLLWGQVLHIRPTQTVFISTCLSLSSTPLVSRFLAGGSRGDKEGDLDYSSVLLGMLVMQDVQLGLFIAVMPTMIQAQSGDLDSFLFGSLRVLYLLAQVLVSLAAVLLLCLFLKSFLIGPYYKKLHAESKGNKEILVLGMAAFVFFMLTMTEFLDVSMELGCFLAGALLSTQGHMVTTEVMGCIEPIRDFLSIIFFASIGLHVFPTFVLYELTILLVLTLTLVIMKVRHRFSIFFSSSSAVHIFHTISPSSFHFTPIFLPVRYGCTSAVGHLASWISTHTLDCLSRSGSGQRILLCLGQPCASCWHHLQRGVPAGSQCHHPQFAAGTSAVESNHTQVGSPGRTQNNHITGPISRTKGFSGTPSKTSARRKSKVLIVHLERLHVKIVTP